MEKISDCLYVKHFELFNTNCPILITGDRVFILDTFMGPLPMRELKDFAAAHAHGKEILIINTHSHFDHIWGNCAFPGASILSHELCRDIINAEGESLFRALSAENPGWAMGEVKITLPSVTFTGSLTFHDKDQVIRICHFPGHTRDSVIVLITPDDICLAGDSVEDPFPLIQESSDEANIDIFIQNLKDLEARELTMVITGHGARRDPALISENRVYLEKLREHTVNTMKHYRNVEKIDIPMEACLNVSPAALSDFYQQAHRDNCVQAREYLAKSTDPLPV